MAVLLPDRASLRKAWTLTLVSVALVALIPFARGIALGHVLYFRDLSVAFYPYRQYASEGLRSLQLRYWDPFVHEGVPLLYPPLAYPIDAVQALWPDRRLMSALLALHVPFAALTFAFLARRLGVPPVGAAAGAFVYALGGFMLSSINLYIYVQAAAWAPLVILALRGAGAGRRRPLAAAGVATALAISTLGIEVAIQAVVVGLVLALRPRRPRAFLASLGAAGLGIALAGPTVMVMRANMRAGERAHGFSPDVVLNQSIHPFTLLQVLAADLYGDLSRLPDRWWGSNFFDRGFPYILSLYLGPTVLALALTAVIADRRRSFRLALMAAAALALALGRYSGLEPVLAALPDPWRVFRYPTKVFFTVHLCVALLASIGARRLYRGRSWTLFACLSGVLGLPLVLVPAVRWVAPSGTAWFIAHFFPPAMALPVREGNFTDLVHNAAQGGALAGAAALIAVAVAARKLRPRAAAALVAAVVAGDLLRAGGGLNPMIDPASLDTSPEIVALLRAQDGLQRVYTCHVEGSPAYWRARRENPYRHEALSLSAWADTLMPHFNRNVHVPSALSQDLTSLIPISRLPPRGVGCADLPALVPRLRAAAVTHVLSLDPLESPLLRGVAELRPARLSPLHVFVYAVVDPVPWRFVAADVRAGEPPPGAIPSPDRVWVEGAEQEIEGAQGSIRSRRETSSDLAFDVETTRATAVVVADGWEAGWSATVNGVPAPVRRAGSHRAVFVPAGRSTVTMSYRPPGLRLGLALAAAGTIVATWLWLSGKRPRATLRPEPATLPA